MSYHVENDAFLCEQKGDFAVVTWRQEAIHIITDQNVREEYQQVFADLDKNPSILGVVQVNALEYPGDAKYRALLKTLIAPGTHDSEEVAMLFTRLKYAISHLVTTAARFTKPLVAAMDGKITAEYLGTVLPYDFRFATLDTVFTFPNLRVGIPVTAHLAFYLVRHVGEAKATEILLTGDDLQVAQAQRLGLITEIVPGHELEHRCFEQLTRVTRLPAGAIAATRRLLRPEPEELEQLVARSFDKIWSLLSALERVPTDSGSNLAHSESRPETASV